VYEGPGIRSRSQKGPGEKERRYGRQAIDRSQRVPLADKLLLLVRRDPTQGRLCTHHLGQVLAHTEDGDADCRGANVCRGQGAVCACFTLESPPEIPRRGPRPGMEPRLAVLTG
jgi:hypothetical protein